jgi:hypothetical protein
VIAGIAAAASGAPAGSATGWQAYAFGRAYSYVGNPTQERFKVLRRSDGASTEDLAMRTTVECPNTFARVTINIRDDKKAVNQGWNRSVSLQCPHCNKQHVIKYRDAYIEGVLSGIQGDLEQLLRPPKSANEGGNHGSKRTQRGRLRHAGI